MVRRKCVGDSQFRQAAPFSIGAIRSEAMCDYSTVWLAGIPNSLAPSTPARSRSRLEPDLG